MIFVSGCKFICPHVLMLLYSVAGIRTEFAQNRAIKTRDFDDESQQYHFGQHLKTLWEKETMLITYVLISACTQYVASSEMKNYVIW